MLFFRNIVFVISLFGIGYTNQAYADSLVDEDRLALKYSMEIRKKIDVSFSESDASSMSNVNYHIDRFAGCHGTMRQAKKNLKPSKEHLQEPQYQTNTFDKGILNIYTSSKPVCVTFDSPKGIVDFSEYTMTFTNYMFFNVWDCMEGCGDEYCIDEQGNEIDMTDWESQISSKHRKDFQKYETARKKEVAEQKKIYDAYKSNYEQWEKERKEIFSSSFVRYQIQIPQDISKGTIAIYNYTWESNLWCDEVLGMRKSEIEFMFIPVEKVKKGQVIDLWLEDASVEKTWGFVLGTDQKTLLEDMQNIQKEVEEKRQRTPPEYLLNRVGESTLGDDSIEMNECCSC